MATQCVPLYVPVNSTFSGTFDKSVAASLSGVCIEQLHFQHAGNLLSAVVLGYQFNWALYGLLLMQTYMYSQSGQQDHLGLRALVYGLFILETLQTILSTNDCWNLLKFGSFIMTTTVNVGFMWFTIPITTGITSIAVQCFYAWRIRVLGGPTYLAGFIVAIALMQGAAALAEGAYIRENAPIGLNDHHWAQSQLFRWNTSIVWLSGTVGCDVIICACMVWLLSTQKTSFTGTKTLLKRLIVLVIETGMITTIIASATLGLVLQSQAKLEYYIVPAFMISKLYTNTLMVILLNRPSTLKVPHEIRLENSHLSSGHSLDRDRANNIQVTIDHESYDDRLSKVSLPTHANRNKDLEDMPQKSIPFAQSRTGLQSNKP